MKASLVDFMSKKASENFKLKEAKFIAFDNIEIDEENAVENNDSVVLSELFKLER